MPALAVIVNEQREELARLDRASMVRFHRIYDEARRDLRERLDNVAMQKEWTAMHLQTSLELLDDAVEFLSGELEVELGRAAGETVAAGTLAMHERWDMLSRRFRGRPSDVDISPAGLNVSIQNVLRRVEGSLLERFDASRMTYAASVREGIMGELLKGSASREAPAVTLTRVFRVGGFMAGEEWRAERIVRTELAHAHENAQWYAGLVAMERGDIPRMKKRLLSVFDNRTARDSYEQHGQTVEWDKPFITDGKEYMHPPNRPNDRATVIPWMRGWKPDAMIGEHRIPEAGKSKRP